MNEKQFHIHIKKAPQRANRGKIEKSKYDFLVSRKEGARLTDRIKWHTKECGNGQKLDICDAYTDEDNYRPEVDGNDESSTKLKGSNSSHTGIQLCNRPVIEQPYSLWSLHHNDETSKHLHIINISAKDSQLDRETHHVWHDITLQESHVHTKDEYVTLDSEGESDSFDGSDISDDWASVASETGLAGSARRKAIALLEREIRHGSLVLV